MKITRRDVGLFLGELRRRRVFRVTVWYAAAAWAVIELATTVFPLIGLGERAEQLVLAGVIASAPLVFILAWVFDITPQGLQRTESLGDAGRADAAAARVLERSGKSIVVLPFTDPMGASANDYFADGVTEDIITALTSLRDVRVISRTSAMQYRSSEKAPSQIAAELGVAHVLDGSIRRAGTRVRIVARLVNARTDEHMWAETYDRQLEDIFAIQSEVAQRIATSLEAEMSASERARLDRPPTLRMDAYDAYLRGRYLWNQRTGHSIRQGIASLREALDADPGFALAWAALAEAHVTLALYGAAAPADVMPHARDAAARALALDPEGVEARTASAAIRLHYDWDWAGAEEEYRNAIERNPRYPTAHHWYANQLAAAARFDEARAALDRARELDPVSPAILTSGGIISYFERDNGRGCDELERVLQRNPGFPLAHMFLGLVLTAQGREAEAAARLRVAVELGGGTAEALSALACSLAGFGHHADARALLKKLRGGAYTSPVLSASVLTALGEHDAAIEQLRAAVAVRAADLVWLGVRPAMDPLRAMPAFSTVLQPVLGARMAVPAPFQQRSRTEAPHTATAAAAGGPREGAASVDASA
jgi:TolB-like protein/Flp pilus assembly protein TadD